VKLLLDQVQKQKTLGIVHRLGGSYIRRAFAAPEKASLHYFEYADIQRQVGYSIQHKIGYPWSYDVLCGNKVIETVSLDWS